VGDLFSIEHIYPTYMLSFDTYVQLLSQPGVFVLTFDNCRFKELYRHRQCLLTNGVFLALLGLDCDRTHTHLTIGFDKDIRTDQLNAFAWELASQWADVYARWLLACTNLRGNKPNSGDVCIHCCVEAADNKCTGEPKGRPSAAVKQQVIETCRRTRLLGGDAVDWDGCEVATVSNASGEPVLRVTARAGARFVNALRPGRDPGRALTSAEKLAGTVQYYRLPKFFADLQPDQGKPLVKHRLESGAEILAKMRAYKWGPSVRSYVKGKSQCVGCLNSAANGTTFYTGPAKLQEMTRTINAGLNRWADKHAPAGFGWTSLQLNAGTVADWHVDHRNQGPSIILVVGEHTGGEFESSGHLPTKLDFEAVLADGRIPHRSHPFQGERYSVVAFTHECRLELSVEDHAAMRRLGYRPASGEFLNAWSCGFADTVAKQRFSPPRRNRAWGATVMGRRSGEGQPSDEVVTVRKLGTQVEPSPSAGEAESSWRPVGPSSASVPSVEPRVVHPLSEEDDPEWAQLGRDGLAVAEHRSLPGLVSDGAARAKVVTMGCIPWLSQVLGRLDDVGMTWAKHYEHTTVGVFGPWQTDSHAFEEWPWSEGPAHAWAVGTGGQGELEVEGHRPVSLAAQVVRFDARDRFRIKGVSGPSVAVVATVNQAWARTRPDLVEVLRSAGFRPPSVLGTTDTVDYEIPEGPEGLEGTAEPVRKGSQNSYKKRGVKERQEELFPELLKEIEEKRAARTKGNPWGGKARYSKEFRAELARQSIDLIGGTEEQKRIFFDRVIAAHPECFYIKGCDPPTISDKLVHFRLKPGSKPVARQPIPLSPYDQLRVEFHIEELIAEGKIRKIDTDKEPLPMWSTPVFIVDQDGKGLMGRMVCSYGTVNSCLEQPTFPSADPQRAFEMAAGKSHHSVVDAIWGYTQFLLDEETRKLLVVCTESGLYEWLRMPFGPAPAPAEMQSYVATRFGDLRDRDGQKFVSPCMDDLKVSSVDFEKHIDDMIRLCKRASKSNMEFKLEKGQFNRAWIKFWGKILDGVGQRLDPKKVEQLRKWPIPRDQAALVSFLCFVNYLRSHMRPGWTDWEATLRPFRKKGVDFQELWNSDKVYQESFEKIREAASEDVVLVHPDYEAAARPDESGRPFEAFFDASDFGWAATLTQRSEPLAAPKIIMIVGAAFTDVQRRWSAMERELYALWQGVLGFDRIIRGFKVSRSTATLTTKTTCFPKRSWITAGGARRCPTGLWTYSGMTWSACGSEVKPTS